MQQTTECDSHKTLDGKPSGPEEKQYTIVSPTKAHHTDVDSTEKSINDPPHSPFVDMFHNTKHNPTLDILDYYTVDENQVITSDNIKILHCYITSLEGGTAGSPFPRFGNFSDLLPRTRQPGET
jgi:hypothetical protein